MTGTLCHRSAATSVEKAGLWNFRQDQAWPCAGLKNRWNGWQDPRTLHDRPSGTLNPRAHQGLYPVCAWKADLPCPVWCGTPEAPHVISGGASVPDQAGAQPQAEGLRVRDLLLQCGQARDHGQRAELLARIADGLDQAAAAIAAHAQQRPGAEADAAGLRGQAGMARVAAELERTAGCACLTQAAS